MHNRLIHLLDALHEVKLLPPRSQEADVVYGYISAEALDGVVAAVIAALIEQQYEVHQCAWRGDTVLLTLRQGSDALAIRLTSSAEERYSLYALSRPQSAQALWQWAQVMARRQSRRRREPPA